MHDEPLEAERAINFGHVGARSLRFSYGSMSQAFQDITIGRSMIAQTSRSAPDFLFLQSRLTADYIRLDAQAPIVVALSPAAQPAMTGITRHVISRGQPPASQFPAL